MDAYLSTMYTGTETTAMDIGAVSAQTVCTCCGKMGHTEADCRFKDAECQSNVCRSGGKGGKSKGNGKGKDNNFSQRMYHGEISDKAWLCCGCKGHVKSNCKFKDEKCSTCGRVGRLRRFAEHAQHTESRRHRIPTRATKLRLRWCGLWRS